MKIKFRLLLPSLLISSALILSGCTHESLLNGSEPSEPESETQTEDMDELSRAIALGKTVRCTEVNPDDMGSTNEYLAKNGMLKINSTDPETQASTHVVITDNTGYFWTEGEETGYTFSFDPESAADITETVESWKDSLPEFADELDGTPETEQAPKINCQEANIDDSEFDLPENVDFVSPSELFQDAIDQAQQEASELQGELTEEQQQQLDDLMQQFGN